nr:MAG TPA: hypothetical protein [Caudoviricetes sp.]
MTLENIYRAPRTNRSVRVQVYFRVRLFLVSQNATPEIANKC